MSKKKLKVAVIGAGIIGTSSALVLKESIPDIDITIISEKWSPNTTGDVSAGLIYPYLMGKTPTQKILKWFRETVTFLSNYCWSPEGGQLGIGLISLYILFGENESNSRPEFADELISYRDLSANELKLFPSKWKSGALATTYFAECTKLIPFMLNKYRSKGGKVLQKRLKNIEELAGQYDIVVNCTGVQAFNLVNDNKVQPIRGQVFRVIAPWIKQAVMAGSHYILPNSDVVILGGTKQMGDWNTDVNDSDSRDIMDNCCEIYPSLRSAQIVRESVGLRPGREETRIETQVISAYGNRDKLYVVHNYGHGGSGVTLFWGCAQEVLVLVNNIVDRLGLNELSKL